MQTYTAFVYLDGTILETRHDLSAVDAACILEIDAIDVEAWIEEEGRVDGTDQMGRSVSVVPEGSEWPGPF
jgi:hypothetical protein